MQHNIDQKEQSRQNNDVGVHRDVAIERHFSDTIWGLFVHSLRKDNSLQNPISCVLDIPEVQVVEPVQQGAVVSSVDVLVQQV